MLHSSDSDSTAQVTSSTVLDSTVNTDDTTLIHGDDDQGNVVTSLLVGGGVQQTLPSIENFHNFDSLAHQTQIHQFFGLRTNTTGHQQQQQQQPLQQYNLQYNTERQQKHRNSLYSSNNHNSHSEEHVLHVGESQDLANVAVEALTRLSSPSTSPATVHPGFLSEYTDNVVLQRFVESEAALGVLNSNNSNNNNNSSKFEALSHFFAPHQPLPNLNDSITNLQQQQQQQIVGGVTGQEQSSSSLQHQIHHQHQHSLIHQMSSHHHLNSHLNSSNQQNMQQHHHHHQQNHHQMQPQQHIQHHLHQDHHHLHQEHNLHQQNPQQHSRQIHIHHADSDNAYGSVMPGEYSGDGTLVVASQQVNEDGEILGDEFSPYPCPYEGCNKSFIQSAHLNVHIRSHTGDRPYICRYCERGFTQLGNLRTHERTHTKEKPFKCSFPGCLKAFAQKGNLKSHEYTHTGKRPFICKIDNCNKAFTQMGNLKSHQQKRHGTGAHMESFEGIHYEKLKLSPVHYTPADFEAAAAVALAGQENQFTDLNR